MGVIATASGIHMRSIRAAVLGCLAVVVASSLVTLAPRPADARTICRPWSPDTDHDRIPDCWERRNGLRVGRKDQRSDKDHDSLTAIQEYLIDRWTTQNSIFRPYQADKARSRRPHAFLDGYEDLDGDGFFNAAEYTWGTAPLRASSFPQLPDTGCITVPGRVPADGSMNVTTQLQTVIDTVPDGRCLSFPAGAQYRSNGELTIFDRHDFILVGNGARLFTNVTGRVITDGTDHSERQQLAIVSGSNITVEGLVIDGPNPRARFVLVYELEAGVKVSGTQGAVLRDLRIKQVYGDFVQIGDWGGGSGNPQPSRDVLITGGDFDVSGRVSVDLSNSSEDVVIDGNSFNKVARSGINLEILPGKHVSRLTVSNNIWSKFGLFWVGSQARGPATDITFVGNQLVGETMQVKLGPNDASGVRHANWTFDSNISDTEMHGSEGIYMLRNMDGVTVTGNVQPFEAGSAGVIFTIDDVCGVTVGENVFTNWVTLFDPAPPAC